MGAWDICRCEYGCCRVPIRWIVTVVLFFAIIVSYGHRTVLNVAIIEMVVPNNKTTNRACPKHADTATMKDVGGGKKKWDQDVQAWLLAMFFPGYILTHLPGGFISDKWGPRWVLLIGITISGLVTFLTPRLVIYTDWKVVAGSRFIAGLGQGILYPAVTSCMQRWVPQSERSTIGGILYAASAWGVVVGNSLTGTIVGYWKSWTAAFSFWGTLTVIWVSFAFLYLFSFPESHPFLTEIEEQFLKDEVEKKSKRPLPICKMLSSCPVWALVAGTVSNNLIVFLMATNFPKYMNNVLNYNIMENGILSSIPFVMMFFTSFLSGLLSDFLLLKLNANVALIRKSLTVFSTIFPAAFIIAGTYSNCDRTLAVTFFSLAMFTMGPAFSSLAVNGLDLTNHHAGFLMALCNGIGSIPGFFSARIVGWVVTENTFEQWHSVLWGFTATQMFLIIFFLIFGTGERAKWDYLPREYEALPPKRTTKWYLQLPPDEFEEMGRAQIAAAARRTTMLDQLHQNSLQ